MINGNKTTPLRWLQNLFGLSVIGLIATGCSTGQNQSREVFGTDDSSLLDTEIVHHQAEKPAATDPTKDLKNNSKDPTEKTTQLTKKNGTWILSSDHHLGGRLNGTRLVDYFRAQKKRHRPGDLPSKA